MTDNKYFSQYAQDKFLNEKIFQEKKNGFFVDLGANDGITLSNTYFFEKYLQWGGVCVEPIPEIFEKLQYERKSKNINACVGDRKKKVNFIVFREKKSEDKYWVNMLSGIKDFIDEAYIDSVKDVAVVDREFAIDMITMDEILEKTNKVIDYLSIDIEGSEYLVINNINFSKYFINTISLEMNHTNYNRCYKQLIDNNFCLLKIFRTQEAIFINKNSMYYGISLKLLHLLTVFKFNIIIIKSNLFGKYTSKLLENKIIYYVNTKIDKILNKI